MASTNTQQPGAEELDYEQLDTGTGMVVCYDNHACHPNSDSAFDEEMPDIQMEDEPPIKRLSTFTSKSPSRLESNEENSASDDSMALDEELFTVSGRQPSRIGSLEAALQSSSPGTATVDTTKYRAKYSYGARDTAVNYRFPNRSAESSDSDTLSGNSPQLGTMSRFSNLGNTGIETHIPDQNTFAQRELESGVASRIKSAVLSRVKLGKRATKAGNVFLLPEYPYKSVHALLLVFEDDDLGVSNEVDELFQVFKYDLNVTTSKKFRIPSTTPFAVLEKLLCDWKAKYSRPENLLIVYFGGHGYQDDFYRIRFSAKEDLSGATLKWSPLQDSLAHTASDVLILLDCCHSGASINTSRPGEMQEGGTTELIAACGFDDVAEGPGDFSFTSALIEELKMFAQIPATFSVRALHAGLVARMMMKSLEKKASKLPKLRGSPVYLHINGYFEDNSILLRSFKDEFKGN